MDTNYETKTIEHQARLPVALQVLDGNQNDTHTLYRSVGTHIEQLRSVGIRVLVKDSAGYSPCLASP